MAVISILEAAAKYGLPAYRFHHWLARGYLERKAKIAGKGQAGEIILDADAVAALVANPPKMGRPPEVPDFPSPSGISKQRTRASTTKEKRCKPCIICGFNRFVEAAHIIPASNGGEYKPDNMLWLCPNHHRLFERKQLLETELQQLPDHAREAYLTGATEPLWYKGIGKPRNKKVKPSETGGRLTKIAPI